MHIAISETNRRREIQDAHNANTASRPRASKKPFVTSLTGSRSSEERAPYAAERKLMSEDELFRVVKDLESQMKRAAKNFEFEKAAMFRDEVYEIRRLLAMAKKDA